MLRYNTDDKSRRQLALATAMGKTGGLPGADRSGSILAFLLRLVNFPGERRQNHGLFL